MSDARTSNVDRSPRLKTALDWSFLALIFSLGFMQPNVALGGAAIPAAEVIFLATGVIWLVALTVRQVTFRLDSVFLLFGLYAIGLLASAILSEDPRASMVKYLGELYLIGLAVLAFNLVTSFEMLKRVVLVWLAASTIVAAAGTMAVALFYLGISNYVTDLAVHGYGLLPPGNYPRIHSTFLYPSMLCNYLSVSVMMLLAAKNLGWVSSRTFAVMLALWSVTIAFTVTPGIGAVVMAFGMWFWLFCRDSDGQALSKLLVAGGALCGVLFIAVSTFSLIETPTSPYFFSIGDLRIDPSPRLLTWQGSLNTFLENPFFGKGLGLGVAGVLFRSPSDQLHLLTDAHNVALSVGAQSGLAALLPLIAICVAVVRRSLLFYAGDNRIHVVQRALLVAFVSAFLIQGLVGSFENARHLWVLIGLILAVGKINPDSQPTAMPRA